MLIFISLEIAALIVIGSFLALVIYKVFKAAKKKTSVLVFAGQFAVAVDEINSDKVGFVRFHGEHWKARSETAVASGQKVKVISREGLTLIVEPIKAT